MPPSPQDRTIGNHTESSDLIDLKQNQQQQHEFYGTSRMIDFEAIPPEGRGGSVYRRRSFVEEFAFSDGPPQIVVLIMLFALGFGSIIGVVPAVMTDRYARINHGYAGDKHCSDYSLSDTPQACLDGSSDAQDAVAVEQLIANILTFFTSSLVGSLSDEHGRKGVLLVGVFFGILSPICLLLIQVDPRMNPIWYYTAAALQGLVNWIAIALSALSDVMPKQWRAPSFGLVLAGFSLGFACAPQLALYMGHFRVTVLSISVVLTAFLVVLVFFPETLPPETAARAKLAREAELEDLEGMDKYKWYLCRPIRELSILNRSTLFRLLSVLAFFSGISSSGDRSLLVYYVEERLGFKDKDIAQLFLIMGFLGIFVQGVFLKVANDAIGERRVVIMSFLVGAVHDLVYSLARSKTAVFASAALASLTMMAFPSISAIKSNNVGETEQGRIQGALYSVQALAAALGPMLFRSVYTFTSKGTVLGSGSMFLFSAAMYIAASLTAYMLPPEANSRQESASSPEETEEEAGPEAPLI